MKWNDGCGVKSVERCSPRSTSALATNMLSRIDPDSSARQFLSQSSEQLELSESANRRRTELSPEDKVDDAARGSCRSIRDSFPSPCRCLAVRDHVPRRPPAKPTKTFGKSVRIRRVGACERRRRGKIFIRGWVASRSSCAQLLHMQAVLKLPYDSWDCFM